MRAIQNIVEVKKIILQSYNIAIILTKSKQNTIVVSNILKEFLNINK